MGRLITGRRGSIPPILSVSRYQSRVRTRRCGIVAQAVWLPLGRFEDKLAKIVLVKRAMRLGGLVKRKAPRDMNLEGPAPGQRRKIR